MPALSFVPCRSDKWKSWSSPLHDTCCTQFGTIARILEQVTFSQVSLLDPCTLDIPKHHQGHQHLILDSEGRVYFWCTWSPSPFLCTNLRGTLSAWWSFQALSTLLVVRYRKQSNVSTYLPSESEHVKNVPERMAATAALNLIRALFPTLVVLPPPVRIRKSIIGSRYVVILLISLFIIRVFIRVVLQRELLESFLDVLFFCVPLNP